MAKCLDKSKFIDMVRAIAQKREITTTHPDVRVNIWDVKEKDILAMVTDMKIPDGIVDKSKRIYQKLVNAAGRVQGKNSLTEPFVKKLMRSYDLDGKLNKNPDQSQKVAALRNQSIALKEVMESIKGERNKADTNNVKLSDISPKGSVLPYLPVPRVAAEIGRKIAYMQGIVFVKDPELDMESRHVEFAYYHMGMGVLENLEHNGFIKIHDEGANTIQDYLDHPKAKQKFSPKEIVIDYVPAIQLIPSSLGINSVKKGNDIKFFTEEFTAQGSKIDTYNSILSLSNLVSVPARITFPSTENPTRLERHHRDDYGLDNTTDRVRSQMENAPVFIDKDLDSFLSLIHKGLKDSDTSASAWIRDTVTSDDFLMDLFGVERSNSFISDRASYIGRNLSKTTPLDDLVEYYNHFEGQAAIYMAMFGGRNARLYNDHSVMNPQTSKLMRHMLSNEPHTLEVGSQDFFYHVDKVARELDLNDDYKGMVNALFDNSDSTQMAKDISSGIRIFEKFQKAKTAEAKIGAIKALSAIFPGMDFAQLTTAMKAAKEIRDSRGQATMETTYMVSSDATASGGTIVLEQALGINPEAITELLKGLRVFKNDGEVPTVRDVYAILETQLKTFVDNYDRENTEQLEANNPEAMRKLVRQVQEVLFEGKTRNLSKDPTMVFIYRQSQGGAVHSLSVNFADRMIKKLKEKPVADSTLKLLNSVMKPKKDYTARNLSRIQFDNTFKHKLRAQFKNTELPLFMYSALRSAVANKYTKPYDNLLDSVFTYIQGQNPGSDFRIYPAGFKMNDAQTKGKDPHIYSKDDLKEHGIPLTKIFEALENVAGEDVLIRVQNLRDTVLGVSAVHGVDAQKQYHSLNGLIPKHGNRGVISAHDELSGPAGLIREWEGNYIENDRKTARDYDILEEALLALEAFKKEENVDWDGKGEYTNLLQQVRDAKKKKQELIDEHYNHETTSIIGDNVDYAFIAEANGKFTTPRSEQPAPEKAKPRDAEVEETQETQKTETKVKTAKLTEQVKILARKSPIIQGFLNDPAAAPIVEGENSSYQIRDGKESITFNNTASDAVITKKLEHEIIHSYSDALFRLTDDQLKNPKLATSLRYVEKAARDIRYDIEQGNASELAGLMISVGFMDTTTSASELLARLNSEPNLAKKVYAHYGSKGSKLEQMIQTIVDTVKKILTGDLPTIQNLSEELNGDKLHAAMQYTLQTGQELRSNQAKWADLLATLPDSTVYNPNDAKAPKVHVFEDPMVNPGNPVNLINQAIARRLNDPLIEQGVGLFRWTDRLLKLKSPAYRRVLQRTKRIYEDSKELQGWMHKITNDNIDNFGKNDHLSLTAAVRTNHNETIDHEIKRFKELTKDLNEQERTDFYDFTHRMSFSDYLLYADGVKDIDKNIKKLEKKLSKVVSLTQLQHIVDMNVADKVVKNGTYNVSQLLPTDEARTRRWVVLKSIQTLGEDRFNNFLKKTDLIDAISDVTLASARLVTEEKNLSKMQVRDSGIVDEYKTPTLKRVISLEEFSKYDYDKGDGWKIASKPTKNTLGVVYKEIIDSTYQDGTFLDLKQSSGDMTVPDHMKNMPRVIKVGKEYKYIMKHEDKLKMGLITNAEQSLVRSMAHNLLIKDTNNLRDAALQRERYWDMNKENMGNLEVLIKDPKRDHPWLLGGDMEYSDLPQRVRAKYMPVAALNKRMSNVKTASGRLDKKVKFVRKDISYWLIGTNEQSIAKDSKIQKILRITKNVVAGAKIGMVINNPAKIGMDVASNIAYLGVAGVDLLFIEREFRKISQEFNDYKKKRNEMIMLRVKSYAHPGKYKAKLTKLEKELEKHPATGFVKRGFVNSMGSDLVMQTDDPSSGFKPDIDKVLKGLFQNKEGKNNDVGQFLMNFSRFGDVGMEDFLEIFAKPFKGIPTTEILGEEMDKIAKRLRDVKSEDDVVGYLHQFINSPDSEFVKLGTHMTDLVDVMAKETYYRYLAGGGMNPKKAELEVIDAFPDYKENMPQSMKQLSDLGILMFPNYWVRIQKAIYRLAKNRPASFGTELLIEDWLNINSPQIWDQNIWSKANSNWGLLHQPWDHLGIGALFPTNIV